jgi:hypothetical protein
MRVRIGSGGFAVDRDYDIFEVLEDGSLIWRETGKGHTESVRKLEALAAKTTNEVRMMHLPTKTLIAAMNTPKS